MINNSVHKGLCKNLNLVIKYILHSKQNFLCHSCTSGLQKSKMTSTFIRVRSRAVLSRALFFFKINYHPYSPKRNFHPYYYFFLILFQEKLSPFFLQPFVFIDKNVGETQQWKETKMDFKDSFQAFKMIFQKK